MADTEMRIAETERRNTETLMLHNVINDYKKENNILTEQVLERDTHIDILDKEIKSLKEEIEMRRRMEFITDSEEEDDDNQVFCECDFPKYVDCNGLQSCKRCGFIDHYKNGIVADHSEDED
tara:strand:- start:293 stop:658 length:366 start_codon:yes stop_codon:yes gene_type:complete